MNEKLIHAKPKKQAGRLSNLKMTLSKAKVRFNSIRTKYNGKEGGSLWGFIFSAKGLKLIAKFLKNIILVLWNNNKAQRQRSEKYTKWLAQNMPKEQDLAKWKENVSQLKFKPLVSILVPVYNTNPEYLKSTVHSILEQIYPNWQLCLVDDKSPKEETREALAEIATWDERINVFFQDQNKHISETSNQALAMAKGEYCVLADHDDFLTPDALYHFVDLLNQHPGADFIYSDEDKTDGEGNFMEPHFKPAWCPDNLLSRNYVGHLSMMRSSIMRKINGFRKGFEGSQDYDIYLRYLEHSKEIYHIPRILYRWRMHEESVSMNPEAKPYAYVNAKKALEEALVRRGEEGEVFYQEDVLGFYSIRYKINTKSKVSIIIPTKNKTGYVKQCIESIFEKSTYPDIEVILIDNGSTEPELQTLIEGYQKKYDGKFNSYRLDIPFNFAKIINFGASQASGEYLLLLNNDTKVITSDWIEALVEQAQRPSIGLVGCKLLFPDNTIQHAGIYIAPDGTAEHLYSGKHQVEWNVFLNSINNYACLTGACLMVRKNVFHELNGLEENFAVDYNDLDLCLKAREKGYYNVYLPHVELYHYESLSRKNESDSEQKYKRYLSEKEAFVFKWQDAIGQLPAIECFDNPFVA
jgi:glycosyltransferase involved in cell wall biosynthesis